VRGWEKQEARVRKQEGGIKKLVIMSIKSGDCEGENDKGIEIEVFKTCTFGISGLKTNLSWVGAVKHLCLCITNYA